jgi:hypothetical protein
MNKNKKMPNAVRGNQACKVFQRAEYSRESAAMLAPIDKVQAKLLTNVNP